MAPAFAPPATLEPAARFHTLDTGAEPGIAARHGMRSTSTLVPARGRLGVARQSVAMDQRALRRRLENRL